MSGILTTTATAEMRKHRKLLEVKSTSITLTMMMFLRMYAYVQTLLIVYSNRV
jgi:hypothetical protein